jgi:hypothetical protein
VSGEHAEQIARAVAATAIGRDGLRWFGERVGRWPSVADPETAALARRALVQRCLYDNFFTAGGARPALPPGSGDMGGVAPLRDRLAAAGRGRSVESGWRVATGDGDGALVVARDGIEVAAPRRAVAGGIRDGAVALHGATYLPGRSPGFAAYRPRRLDGGVAPPIVRAYWNVSAAAAPVLVRALRRGLDAAGVPYALKAAHDPGAYVRADAAVLYLPARDLSRAAPCIAAAHRRVATSLSAAVPPLTLRAAPGLGLAIDPADGTSFGMHRCDLLAAGIAAAAGAPAAQRAARVGAHLEAAGVALAAPYTSGGTGAAELEEVAGALAPRPRRPRSRTQPLDVARSVGRRLGREAIWAGAACTWVEAAPPDRAGPERATALGGDVYGGTAGIALFLAELARATGEEAFAVVAAGAARHALARAPRGRGLYTGPLGTALAVWLAGEALGDGQLRDAALAHAGGDGDLPGDLGVVSGRAGDVLALAALARLEGGAHLAPRAVEAARALARADLRVRRGGLVSGYAHGASGVACALLEAAALAGDPRLAAAAHALLDDEDATFSAAEGSWRDLRYPRRPGVHSVAWCHGAGGAVLARWRAGATGDRFAAGLDTVVRHVTERRARTAGAHSLCHGYPGLVDVAAVVGGRSPPEASARQVVAAAHRELEVSPGSSGLLTGAAGVGMVALRIAVPQVPSVLRLGLGDPG